MRRTIAVLVFCACGPAVHVEPPASAPAISIVPLPSSIERKSGAFHFGRDTVVVATGAAADPARVLADQLAPALGAPLQVRDSAAGSVVELVVDPTLAKLGSEGYRLTVTSSAVQIRATSAAGLFYGTQTLRQLMPPAAFAKRAAGGTDWVIPAVEIEDHPRFAWRGALLDPARNFLTIAELEDFIDLIAMHKLNVLQLHLTDDQGWRIEIKKYPKLTEIGSHRTETVIGHPWDRDPPMFDGKPHAGFYTQDEIRHLVEYAQRRYVTLVPEIEMPGHTQAAVASYPELGSTNGKLPVSTNFGVHDNILVPSEQAIAFMQDVLVEVMALFPSPYIHTGGDEAKKDQWKKNPVAQARIRELGLKDEDALQGWFTARMDKFLTEHGRKLIGWDEILEGGLSPNATVMSWRGEDGGVTAANAGHDVVMAPGMPTYLDSCQTPNEADCKAEPLTQGTYIPIDMLIEYDPMPAALRPDKYSHVLGAESCIWGEFTPSYQRVSYQAWPRLAAFAEAVWTAKDRRDKQDFWNRFKAHLPRLDAAGVQRFHKADGQPAVRKK